MKLVIERPHDIIDIHGSSIFVGKDVIVNQTSILTKKYNIEVLDVNLGKQTVTWVYKPPRSSYII